MSRPSSSRSSILGPLPRRDILAVCAFLNRSGRRAVDACTETPSTLLERRIAAARMQ